VEQEMLAAAQQAVAAAYHSHPPGWQDPSGLNPQQEVDFLLAELKGGNTLELAMVKMASMKADIVTRNEAQAQAQNVAAQEEASRASASQEQAPTLAQPDSSAPAQKPQPPPRHLKPASLTIA
jgi:cell division septation protein DedD